MRRLANRLMPLLFLTALALLLAGCGKADPNREKEVKTIEALQERNKVLGDQVAELKTQVATLKAEAAAAKSQMAADSEKALAELTDRLLEAGYRVYLLSNAGWDVSRNRHIIPRIERFHGVIFSVEEGIIKPNPELYRRLTDRFGLVPEECLFIDDNPDNIRGAQALGWQGYLFDGDVPALQRALDGLARA